MKENFVDANVKVEMVSVINASGNDKNILNEFYDTNIFANLENYVSYSRNVMRHEAA